MKSYLLSFLALVPAPFHGGEDPGSGLPFVAGDGPQLLAPGRLSTNDGEYSPTFDPQRGELVFMRRTPGRFDYTLHASRWEDGAWTEPRVLPFSGEDRDGAPCFSPDGTTLAFDSRRPAAGLEDDSINVWLSRRDGEGWTAPELVRAASENPPPTTKAGADEFGPVLDARGDLYFYSFRRPFRGGHHWVVRAEDPDRAEREEALPDPSAETFVSYLTLSADGRTAVLEGRAPGGRDTDLFLSERHEDGSWSAPRPLAAVNTTANEGTPYLTPDGRWLLFGSTRPTGRAEATSSNLWVISTRSL